MHRRMHLCNLSKRSCARYAKVRVVSGEPQRRPKAWGVSIAWISSLYQSGGRAEFVDDGFGDDPEMGIQVGSAEPPSVWEDDSWLAREDIIRNPHWHAWLTEYLSRDHDIFLMLQVNDRPRRKLVYSFSKKQQQHRFTLHLPVQEFLVTGERELVRQACCELYAAAAAKLELPPPPPPVTTTFD